MFEGLKLTLNKKKMIGIAYDIICNEYAYLQTFLITKNTNGYFSFHKFHCSVFESLFEAKMYAKNENYLPLTYYIEENRKKQRTEKTKIYRYK